jgi:hypothetical protein
MDGLTYWLQTWLNKLKTQKSPQGLRRAGSQDFDEGSGNHQPRILVELAESYTKY